MATAPRPRRALGLRLVPVAATVVAVAGLAAGAMWLAPGNDSGTQAGSPPTTASTAPPTSTPRGPVPTSPDDLIARFKDVLGDTATFEVKDRSAGPAVMTVPQDPTGGPDAPVSTSETKNADSGHATTGAFIVGTLTTAAGAKGGFDLQIFAGQPGEDVFCDDPDRSACAKTTLPDGSKLAIGSEPLQDPGGITYMANLVRPDGTVLLMHLSNQEDPKGAGVIYSAQPPLNTDQLRAIATSQRWW